MVAAVPVLAYGGIVRPHVESNASSGGEWNQDTGIGHTELLVQNHGWLPVTVTAATSPTAPLEVTETRIPAGSEAWVRIDYVAPCATLPEADAPGVFTEEEAASGNIRVEGIWPMSLEYTLWNDPVFARADMCPSGS
ncbi:MAG: hypothetical protein ACFCVC_02790 [Acidimicrobiia bacterium]